MGIQLTKKDIFSVLEQMPSSILFKFVGADEIYASAGFTRAFGIQPLNFGGIKSVKFYDISTKKEVDTKRDPFYLSEKGSCVSGQFRIQTQSRTMICFVTSEVIATSFGKCSVLNIVANAAHLIGEFKKDSAVNKHITFNQLLTNFSSKLINANVSELDSIIDHALAAFGEFCDVDRCYLFKFGDTDDYMSNTHEWVAAGVTPYIDELQNIPTNTMPFFMSHISNGIFKVDDVSSIPDSASSERELFQEQRIFSILCVRIMVDGTMYGFIGCDIIGGPYSWKASDIEYLRRIGEMLGNTLQNLYNRKALQKVQVELLEANKQLERLANIDGLTGIANRRLFDSTLERDVARCYEQGRSLSLLLIDVDLFKQYNDAYGHVAGDTVLKNIANTLTNSCVGSDDLVARYGGEEFAVILPDTQSKALSTIAARILRNVMFLNIFHEASAHDRTLTVSIGMATISNLPLNKDDSKHKEEDAMWLLEQADKALYRAKNAGRNCARS